MAICSNCRVERPDGARFCDACGARLIGEADPNSATNLHDNVEIPQPAFLENSDGAETVWAPSVDRVNITSLDQISQAADEISPEPFDETVVSIPDSSVLATLTIERGDAPGTVFELKNPNSIIGRWDADNGIFPDVDLDAYDPDAKVSRKHAKLIAANGKFFVEDLGSTNGTYINRGRRLLPGTPQQISDGDEVIVGKTFLRFKAP